MTTFNFELNSRPSRLGTYIVFLRITQDRMSKKIKTIVELNSKNDWNSKKQEVKTKDCRPGVRR